MHVQYNSPLCSNLCVCCCILAPWFSPTHGKSVCLLHCDYALCKQTDTHSDKQHFLLIIKFIVKNTFLKIPDTSLIFNITNLKYTICYLRNKEWNCYL